MSLICEHCNGTGYVTHPFWVAFYSQKEVKDPEEFMLFHYKGELTDEEVWRGLPEEEQECQICHGWGKFKSLFEKMFYEISNGEHLISLSQARELFEKYYDKIGMANVVNSTCIKNF